MISAGALNTTINRAPGCLPGPASAAPPRSGDHSDVSQTSAVLGLYHTEAPQIEKLRTVAALYVETAGAYFNMPDIDPWDEARDARTYDGPWPVIGHPPCQRWGKMWFGQPLAVKRTGVRKIKGDDGGCFKACLASARKWGGLIEHPWGSHAWPHFGLNVPPRAGGWIAADFEGGWTCCVEQGRYGHYARKPTLLLVYGVALADLPELEWGIGEPRYDPAVIERMGLARAKRLGEVAAKGGGTDSSPRISTPPPFRELLLSIARSAGPLIQDDVQSFHNGGDSSCR